jgi:hypothetical protein
MKLLKGAVFYPMLYLRTFMKWLLLVIGFGAAVLQVVLIVLQLTIKEGESVAVMLIISSNTFAFGCCLLGLYYDRILLKLNPEDTRQNLVD